MENNKKKVNWAAVGAVVVAVIGALTQSGGVFKN